MLNEFTAASCPSTIRANQAAPASAVYESRSIIVVSNDRDEFHPTIRGSQNSGYPPGRNNPFAGNDAMSFESASVYPIPGVAPAIRFPRLRQATRQPLLVLHEIR